MHNYWIMLGMILAASILGEKMVNSACLLSDETIIAGYFTDTCTQDPTP